MRNLTPYWKAAAIAVGFSAPLLLTGCFIRAAQLVEDVAELLSAMAQSAERAAARAKDAGMKLTPVGKIAAGDVFPVGELYIVDAPDWLKRSVLDIDGETNAWLLVKFGSPTWMNERSYRARTTVNCVTHVLSVFDSKTYATEDMSQPVLVREHSPPIIVDKPSAIMKTAIGRICEGKTTRSSSIWTPPLPSSSGFGANLNLSALNGINGFQISDEAPNYYSGIDVSAAGDVNGDGIDDLLIGAQGAYTTSVS